MIRKWNGTFVLFAAFTLFLESCSPLMPAAYPNPPSAIPAVTSSPTLAQPTPTLGPVMDMSMPTSQETQIWLPVGAEQVAKNEEVMAIARPLLEKARRAYIMPGWLHIRSETESFRSDMSTLPDGTPIPTHWQDESWTLIDAEGLAIQSVSLQDTGDARTSQVSTFQDGVWKNLTYGTLDEGEETYSIPLDNCFSKDAEDSINFITLEYNDTETVEAERVLMITLNGPKMSPQSTSSYMRKCYYSMETGLLLRMEQYRPSPTRELEIASRSDIKVTEKVEQPPAEVMKYFSDPLNYHMLPEAVPFPFFEDDARREYCTSPAVQLSLAEAKGLSEDEIAAKLMKLFLDYFNTPQAPNWCRIDGYTIDKVYYDERTPSLPLEPKGDIMRVVLFSIQLVELPSFWVSWQGKIDDQNWLHAGRNVAIFRSDDGYTMEFANP